MMKIETSSSKRLHVKILDTQTHTQNTHTTPNM